jgi:hypothetical protein
MFGRLLGADPRTVESFTAGVVLVWVLLLFLLQLSCIGESKAQDANILKGSVEENENARTRIHRFDDVQLNEQTPAPIKTRIHRSGVGNSGSQTDPGNDMLPEFAKVDPNLFTATTAKPFDLEAESNSRELMLAWDLWHKQLSQAIYKRVPLIAIGGCAYQLTITKNHHIAIKILQTVGSPLVRDEVIRAAQSLDGNEGLSFPAGSRRQVANDYLTILCGPNVRPGFDWQHGDVEKIRLDW